MMKKNQETQRPPWHWKRMVSGIREGDNSRRKLVNDLKKMTDRLSLTLTEKIQIHDITSTSNKKEEEDRFEMFKSDLTAAFQLMLQDTGLDKVVKVPPADVKYAAIHTQTEEEEEEIISFAAAAAAAANPPPSSSSLPMTPPPPKQSNYSERPSLASSDVSSSMMDDEDYHWLSPKSESSRKVHNDIPGNSLIHDGEFYFDLSHLDEE